MQSNNCFDIYLLTALADGLEMTKILNNLVTNSFGSICDENSLAYQLFGGCVSVDTSIVKGTYLCLIANIIQWIVIIYTFYVMNKINIYPIKY